MSKKKKKKQQMHVSASQKNTPVQTKTPAKQETADKKNDENAIEIRMNFYSAMAMLTTLLAAVSVVLGMVLSGRGFYYVLQGLYDEEITDIVLLNDNLLEADFSPKMLYCMYVIAGVLVVMVILSLIGTFAAINPRKKPNIIPAVIMIVLSLAAIALYLVGNTDVEDILASFSHVQQSRHIGIYSIYLYVLIANSVCAVINLFGQLYGLKKYKEKGITC